MSEKICECKSTRGEKLYNCYASWTDYKSFNGEDLKKFNELPDHIRMAWIMASNGKIKPEIHEKEESPKPKLKPKPKPKGKKTKVEIINIINRDSAEH
jgi:hypothetical protein